MPIQWNFEKNNLCVFRISGKLVKAELERVQSEYEATISKIGTIASGDFGEVHRLGESKGLGRQLVRRSQ